MGRIGVDGDDREHLERSQQRETDNRPSAVGSHKPEGHDADRQSKGNPEQWNVEQKGVGNLHESEECSHYSEDEPWPVHVDGQQFEDIRPPARSRPWHVDRIHRGRPPNALSKGPSLKHSQPRQTRLEGDITCEQPGRFARSVRMGAMSIASAGFAMCCASSIGTRLRLRGEDGGQPPAKIRAVTSPLPQTIRAKAGPGQRLQSPCCARSRRGSGAQ